MSRRFPDFFDAFQDYTQDEFVPAQFNQWSCLSTVAAALERKVWLQWSDSWACYPNIYVLLVAGPGEGKTQALRNSVGLLDEANRRLGGSINMLPNQATEAAFIKLVGQGRSFTMGTRIVFQNAAFYRAEEASASLRNIYGEFLACLTDLYDCPDRWARATVKDGTTPIELKNVCINLLAASTFDYLSELVNDKNIMGGFASRLIYVLSKNKPITAQRFQGGGRTAEIQQERNEYRKALVDDLCSIHKIMGPMSADEEFKAAWESWWVESETQRKSYGSEKLQSLLVRANLHMLKTSMLFSACESDERVLRKRHWDRALSLVTPAMATIPDIFRESRAQGIAKGQKNVTHAIFHALASGKEFTASTLRGTLIAAGGRSTEIDSVLGALISIGDIRSGGGGKLEILGDPNDHF
jgi:hypothetical protein